jgi:hypothetical protein
MAWTRWSYPTDIRFGAGALGTLPSLLEARGAKAPLVVTDAGLVGTPPLLAVLRTLEGAGLLPVVYAGFSPNPTASEVAGGVALYREHRRDCIVGVGGGSGLDGAKAVQLMTTHPGNIEQYDDRVGGYDRMGVAPVPPHFAVPTTAGTGSEVGRSTVIVNESTHEKMVIFHPILLPTAAIVDPEVMSTLPPHLTAATGMDALTHNVESYLALGVHHLADGIALHGVRLVARNLARAVRDGNDLDARAGMAAASLMGAVAFQKGLGVTHSLAHPLSTLAGMNHGLANGILIPYAMEYNAQTHADSFVLLAESAGLGTLEPARAAAAFVQWLIALRAEIGIPHTLTEAGVSIELLPALSEQAFRDGCHASNPRPVGSEHIETLYRRAFSG